MGEKLYVKTILFRSKTPQATFLFFYNSLSLILRLKGIINAPLLQLLMNSDMNIIFHSKDAKAQRKDSWDNAKKIWFLNVLEMISFFHKYTGTQKKLGENSSRLCALAVFLFGCRSE